MVYSISHGVQCGALKNWRKLEKCKTKYVEGLKKLSTADEMKITSVGNEGGGIQQRTDKGPERRIWVFSNYSTK